eukprot:PITA_27492
MGSGWCLLLFVVVLYRCAEASKYLKYEDPSQPINARVEDLLARMTLAEKIGQMTQIERSVATADVMKNYYIGSVLSGGGSVPAPKASPATWINLVDGLQKGALSTRLQIPMIDPDLARRIGAATALEVRATGIQYVFAPCVAVCRDPRWGRCYESYSEDPKIVKAMTKIISGLQGQAPTKGIPFIAGQSNVAACAKHFVGDGGTTDGINENNTVISYKGLVKIHMAPYFDAIARGVSTIMISYSSWNGLKMHANHFLISQVLKKQLGFKVHRELAREAVRKSLVLLKNGKSASKPLLPLNKNAAKILVAGTHADNLGYQCGGWTITWQGLSGNSTKGTTILEAIKSTVSPSTEVVYQENPDAKYVEGQGFSYAIVLVGEAPYAETFGDNLNLTIPLGGADTIKNVCGSVKCLVILISGRPLVIEPYLPLIDAFVAAWLPGTEGQGVTDVIFGDQGFRGKLSRTWFKRVDQLPMNVGDKHYDPLFPLGFGLT